MRALMKYAPEPGNMEIRDIPEPTPGPGQVKIKVVASGICGSDLHIHDSDIAIPVRPPVVTGHEFSGVIAEVGEGVEGWKVGDRVVSETAIPSAASVRHAGKAGITSARSGRHWDTGTTVYSPTILWFRPADCTIFRMRWMISLPH